MVGGLAIQHLSDKYEFSNLSRRPVEDMKSTEASIGDLDAIRPAFKEVDMVLHLAAFTEDSGDWDGQLDITTKGTVNVFRAAQDSIYGAANDYRDQPGPALPTR